MKLFAFGCSHTYGYGLSLKEDYWKWEDKKTGRAIPGYASPYAYPSILAEKLGLECDNRAIPGGSCKEIMLNILETNFSLSDSVIVCWPSFARWCIVKDEDPRISRIGPWSAKQEDTRNFINKFFSKPDKNNYAYDTRMQEIATSYYKDCWDTIDAEIEMHKNIQFAYLYLKDKVNKQYHFSVDLEGLTNWSTETWFDVSLLDTNLKDDLISGPDQKLEDGHPSKKGHAVIAERLYNLIQEREK